MYIGLKFFGFGALEISAANFLSEFLSVMFESLGLIASSSLNIRLS